MKKIFLSLLITVLFIGICEAKTLVKYYKNTGDIIQTNTVDQMPPADILADRFKSETTDVLLYDGPVDIQTQRVDLNVKTVVDIPKKELDNKATVEKAALDKKQADRQKALEKLTAIGNFTADEINALFN